MVLRCRATRLCVSPLVLFMAHLVVSGPAWPRPEIVVRSTIPQRDLSPIDNAPALPPRPRLPHLPTLPNQPVRTSAERHGGHSLQLLVRDSVTAVKPCEGDREVRLHAITSSRSTPYVAA